MFALGRREHRTEVQGALDGVLARLVSADPFGFVDVADALDRSEDVEVLPDVQFDPQFVPDPHRLRWSALHQAVGVDEREVADENCHPLAEPSRFTDPPGCCVLLGGHRVGGRLTSSGHGVVHDVVVEQRESVHQLEGGPGVDVDLVGASATGTDVSPVREGWAEALPARQHESADLVDRLREVGVEGCPALAFGAQQFVEAGFDSVGDRAEAGRRGSRHLHAGYCCVCHPASTCGSSSTVRRCGACSAR